MQPVRRVTSTTQELLHGLALNLTPEGGRLLAVVRPVVEALQGEILAPLSRAERAAFLALAHKALGLG